MPPVVGLAVAAALTLAVFSCLSCSQGQASGTVPDGVQFWEREPGRHVLVDWFPDEDCLLVVRQGADTGNLERVLTNCTDEELAEGRRLLGTEAWKAYESANIPSVASDPTGAGGADAGEADSSGDLELPPAGGDRPVGSILVDNGLIEEGEPRRTFWADDLGPEEAELVAYFRALHEKYGKFE